VKRRGKSPPRRRRRRRQGKPRCEQGRAVEGSSPWPGRCLGRSTGWPRGTGGKPTV